MRSLVPSLCLVATVLAPIACGGTPAPTPTTPPATPATAPPTVIAAPPPVDLSPVSEPPDLFATVRWRSPAKSFAAFQTMFGVPVPVEELTQEMLRANAASVAGDAPVDAIFVLDPSGAPNAPPWIGLSIGMRSLEEARQVFEKRQPLSEVRPGVYKVGRRQGLSCLLGAAAGAAPARVVCSDREEQALTLMPYMTRSLPLKTTVDQDLHGEVVLGPVQNRYGRQLPMYLQGLASFASHYIGTGNRKLDNAVSDAMNGLSSETMALLNDLDGLSFNLNMTPGTSTVDGDLSLKLKGRSSWISQRMLEKAPEAGPPPAIFWKAPIDSDVAAYSRASDPKHFTAIRQAGGDLLEGLLSTVNFPAGTAVRQLWDKLFLSAPVVVSAQGHLDPPTATGGDKFEEMKAAAIAALGWQVMGLEEPSKRSLDFLNELAGVYNRPAVREWIVKQTGVDRALLPTAKVSPFGKDKDTRALEIKLSLPGAKGKAITASYWIAVMPDGQRTWIGFGADKAAIEKHLGMVRSTSSDTQTIASKPGLESLKSGRAISAGYVTLSSFASAATGGIGDILKGHTHGSAESRRMVAAIAKVPNHGQTPILFESQAQVGTPSEVSVRLRMTKGSVDDVAAFLKMMMPVRR